MNAAAKAILRGLGIRRQQIAAARLVCERNALARLRISRCRSSGRVLCYHSVGQPHFGVNDVAPDRFRRQIEQALAKGYRFVPAARIADGGCGPMDLAVTFDDGARSVLTEAAPFLSALDIPFTAFIVTDWAEQVRTGVTPHFMSWGDVETLPSYGGEIGSHSVTHPDFGRIDRDRARDELLTSRDIIERRLGATVESFAIPYGMTMNWPAHVAISAKEAGYQRLYAQAEQTRPEGTAPRSFVTRYDDDTVFGALLDGAFDRWQEWY